MNQNINFTLLGLLVVVLIALITMSFYYDGQYTNLSDKYKQSLSQNSNLTHQLFLVQEQIVEKNTELSEKIKNLNLSSSEVTKFQAVNRDLDEKISKMDFEEIYKSINNLKFKANSIGDAELKAKLNTEIKDLERELMELETLIVDAKNVLEEE